MRRRVLVLLSVVILATVVALVIIYWPWLRGLLPQSRMVEAWLQYLVVDLNIGRWGPVATLLLVALVELVWALNLGRRSESVERQWKRLERTHAQEIELLEDRLKLVMDERASLLAELELREDLIREEKARLWAQFQELQRGTSLVLQNDHADDEVVEPILKSRSLAPWHPALPPEQRVEWLRVISQLERIEMVSSVTVRASHEAQYEAQRGAEYLQLGRACHQLGQYERALAHYNKGIDLLPSNHESLVNRAVVNLDLGRNQAALQDLDRALKLNGSAWAYLYRGLIQEQLGEERRAQENYSRSLRTEPLAEAYYRRGLGHLRTHEYEMAFQDLSRALELDSEHAMAHAARGRARAALGDSQWALSDLDTGCSLAPGLPDPFFYRGLVRYEQAMYDSALADFTEAIERDAEHADAYLTRGRAFAALRRHKHAIADYDRAIELEPKNATAYHARGQARMAVDEFGLAVEDYTHALELDPGSALILASRGEAYEKLGQHDRAIEDLDRAVALDPSLAAAYYTRGLAYGSKGEYDRASRDLDRAVERDPSFAEREHNLPGEGTV